VKRSIQRKQSLSLCHIGLVEAMGFI